MSRRPNQLPLPKTANLTVEEMTRGITRLQKRIDDLEAFDPQSVQERWPPEVTALRVSIEETLAAVFGHSTVDYHRYESAATLDNGPIVLSTGVDHSETLKARQYLSEGKKRSILLLKQAIRGLEERIKDQRESSTSGLTTNSKPQKEYPRKVFVVHGHEGEPREAVARFLERLDLEPVILHEQANQSRTVIEKIEAHSEVGFAVVLLTPDDEGSLKGEPPQPRARQNVLLELGYFIGKLTRKRVCTLKVGELEIPSDWRGVIDEPFDGSWKQTLARELDAAGYKIDWNKVMR
jgi:predicted nucleotide-binding protein